MYFLCLVGLVLTVVVVTQPPSVPVRALAHRVFGRTRANVQSFGVRVVRMKLYAFALAGGIAGFAGALLEVKTRGADGLLFGAEVSLNLFTIAIIGGIAGPAGALLGAAYQNILHYFFPGNQIVGFLAPLVPLLLIYARPGRFLEHAAQPPRRGAAHRRPAPADRRAEPVRRLRRRGAGAPAHPDRRAEHDRRSWRCFRTTSATRSTPTSTACRPGRKPSSEESEESAGAARDHRRIRGRCATCAARPPNGDRELSRCDSDRSRRTMTVDGAPIGARPPRTGGGVGARVRRRTRSGSATPRRRQPFMARRRRPSATGSSSSGATSPPSGCCAARRTA